MKAPRALVEEVAAQCLKAWSTCHRAWDLGGTEVGPLVWGSEADLHRPHLPRRQITYLRLPALGSTSEPHTREATLRGPSPPCGSEFDPGGAWEELKRRMHIALEGRALSIGARPMLGRHTISQGEISVAGHVSGRFREPCAGANRLHQRDVGAVGRRCHCHGGPWRPGRRGGQSATPSACAHLRPPSWKNVDTRWSRLVPWRAGPVWQPREPER